MPWPHDRGSPSPYRNRRKEDEREHSRRYSEHGRRKVSEKISGSESPSRSPSPARRRRTYAVGNEMVRPHKRQRHGSRSPSFDRRREDSRDTYDRPSRHKSRSRLPYPRKFGSDTRSRKRKDNYGSPESDINDHRRSRRYNSRSISPSRRKYERYRQSPDRSRHARHRSHSSSNGQARPRKRDHASASPPPKRSKAPLPSQQAAFSGETTVIKPDQPAPTDKQKPNYAPSGLLAAETNTVTTGSTAIVLKYHEPPEARLPPSSAAWRLYIFKGKDLLETLELHTRSCWLFGRERAIVDVPVEHPSASKQHAVIQFRYTEKKNEWGDRKGEVKPYVIDLDSANGTKVNGEKVEGRRYVELRTGDVIRFGESSREYVLLLPPKR